MLLAGSSLAFLLVTVDANEVTFSEHIAPIVYQECTVCHRPGEIGPMPFTNYEETAVFAQAIRSVIDDGTMPPWPPDRSFSRFVGERGLSDDQVALIHAWVEDGAPEGDPSLAPPLPDYPEGSVLGEPDLTLKMSEAYTIQGDGRDEYRVFVLPTGLTEDKDLVAVEFRPGNTEIVHHALMVPDTTGEGQRLDAADSKPGYKSVGGFGVSFLQGLSYPGWVPGATPRFFPAGTGIKLPAGADLLLQIHYAPWPVEASDQSSVNLFFAEKPVERYIQTRLMLPSDLVDSDNEYHRLSPLLGAFAGTVIAGGVEEFLGETVSLGEAFSLGQNATLDTVFGDQIGGTAAGFLEFDIPADTKRTFKGKWEINKDISLLNVWPHMHYLGTDWEIVLEFPNGSTENLIRINSWDFDWQGNYTFPKFIKAPKGSRVYASASYDNTRTNFANPNFPPVDVGWGEKTEDEMYFLPFAYVDYQEGDELISLDSYAPGDLPIFRVDALSVEEIRFRLQGEASFRIEHSLDLDTWQSVGATESGREGDWRLLTLPRTEGSAGFYRAVLTP